MAVIPLRVWLLSFITTVVLSVSIQFLAPFWQEQELNAQPYLNMKRLADNSEVPKLLALGSSLTEFAFFDPKQAEEHISSIVGKIDLVRMTVLGATRSSYQNQLDKIASLHPHWVIVELEILLLDSFEANSWGKKVRNFANKIRYFFQHLQEQTQYLLINKVPSNFEGNFDIVRKCPYKGRGFDIVQAAQRYKKNLRIRQDTLPDYWIKFFDRVRSYGGHVIIVQYGISQTGQEFLPADFSEHLQQQKDLLTGSTGIEIWRFPGPFEDINYCGLGHLAPQGSEQFIKWLSNKLAAAANE